MKKIIASAIVAAATLSASQAAVFNGYSAGLTAGVVSSKVKHSHKFNNVTERNNLNKTYGAYGVHFDYDRSASNSFYWGLGLDFLVASGKKTKTITGQKASVKYSWMSELDARLGYNFCNNVAVYGLAGLRLYKKESSFNIRKVSGATISTSSMKETGTRFAPTLGLGAKVKVSNQISLGAEYRYAFEKDEKYNSNQISQKAKNSSHAVLAKVSYHF